MGQIHRINGTKDFKIDCVNALLDCIRPEDNFHDSFEIDYFIKADVQFFLRDRTYHICEGDMFFIGEFDMHKVICAPGEDYIRFVINFKRSFMEDVLRSMDLAVILEDLDRLKSSRIKLSPKRRKEVRYALQKLISQSAKMDDPYTESRIKLQTAQFLMSISEYIKDSPRDNGANVQSLIVKKIIGYMDANHDKTITPDYLEEWLSISKYHISRVFERTTGFTITEYLKTRSAIEARKRLVNTGTTSEIKHNPLK